jgi:hypothetical protein
MRSNAQRDQRSTSMEMLRTADRDECEPLLDKYKCQSLGTGRPQGNGMICEPITRDISPVCALFEHGSMADQL